ncbi:MFS transporter [Streptomyces marincola]|uniref:MFS transporter n=1 Tax=Streptomyces marincola TaxID=2878388 RepID=UPI001CF0FAFC|nr:MFS transporter [Streptomyces marincola]UCM90498.1 MFS transporter [Streptomyces marincola]
MARPSSQGGGALAPDDSGKAPDASAWRGVLVLGFGTFAVGTDEFVLAGVLHEFSDSLDVPVTTAGQVVTVFALTCAVMSPVLGTLTAAWPRHRVLQLAVALYLIGVIGTAPAPSFPLVLR